MLTTGACFGGPGTVGPFQVSIALGLRPLLQRAGLRLLKEKPMTTDSEFEILDILYQAQKSGNSSDLSQRELAQRSELSLGMTNMVLKRLLTRGWLTAQQVNIRKVRYLMTSEGVNEFSRRSYRYFKRTIKNVVKFKDAVDRMISAAKRAGHTSVLLVGKSDLDFIVEHACEHHGLLFLTSVEPRVLDGALVVFSEDAAPPAPGSADTATSDGTRYLSQVISAAELE